MRIVNSLLSLIWGMVFSYVTVQLVNDLIDKGSFSNYVLEITLAMVFSLSSFLLIFGGVWGLFFSKLYSKNLEFIQEVFRVIIFSGLGGGIIFISVTDLNLGLELDNGLRRVFQIVGCIILVLLALPPALNSYSLIKERRKGGQENADAEI